MLNKINTISLFGIIAIIQASFCSVILNEKSVPIYAFSEDGSSIRLVENIKLFTSAKNNSKDLKIINVHGLLVPYTETHDSTVQNTVFIQVVPENVETTDIENVASTPILSSIALILIAVILGICTFAFTGIFLVMCIQSTVGANGTVNPLARLDQ